MPIDGFAPASPGLSAPGRASLAVTPSDGADLVALPRSIYVGTGGTVRITLADDTPGNHVDLLNVPSGTLLPLRASRVWSTGTTASDMVAIY